MSRLSDNDLFDAAVMIEEAYEIDIHKDIIFSNELNAYYNCKFNPITDSITFNVEVDEGNAQFFIKDYFNECEISCNWTACDYVSRIEMKPIKDIPLYE